MANTDNPNGFQLAYTKTGGPAVMIKRKVAASQTIVKGDPVVLGTAGTITIDDGAGVSLEGIAAEGCVTTAADELTEILLYAASNVNVFVGQCSGSSATALLGDHVDIEGSTGIFEINEDAGSTKVIKLIGLHKDDAEGANGRMFFTIAKSSYENTEIS